MKIEVISYLGFIVAIISFVFQKNKAEKMISLFFCINILGFLSVQILNKKMAEVISMGIYVIGSVWVIAILYNMAIYHKKENVRK